jgi:hypothetical protein
MAIEASLKGVTDFLQDNEHLIETIRDTAKSATGQIKKLDERLTANREQAAQMIDKINQMKFAVSPAPDIRQRQRLILGKIEQVSKDIQLFADEPDILIMLYLERSGLYMALGNTYNDLVPAMVIFSPEEVDSLRVLLRRATLDTESRKQLAHLLDAAVQLSKLALGVAGKLVA